MVPMAYIGPLLRALQGRSHFFGWAMFLSGDPTGKDSLQSSLMLLAEFIFLPLYDSKPWLSTGYGEVG